ncbi:MAG: sulfotransferase [Planctomycetota bacterium]
MAEPLDADRPPALVITGMHRSGTSLTASLLATAGVHLGDELMPAAAGNPRGHFEDLEFYNLHQRILAGNGLSMEGFTCQEAIEVPAAARAQAADMVRRRRAAGRPWGWKDPRTTLFLDFWAELVPEARWLFVVRPPAEVCDSLLRRGDTAFVVNPRHAVDVWVAYNRRILDFARRHGDRTIVVDLSQVVTDPAGVVSRAAELLAVPLATPAATYEPGLLVTGQPGHREGIVIALRPEVRDLQAEILRLAAPAAPAAPVALGRGLSRPTEVAAAALIEWAAACRAVAERGGFAVREAEAQRKVEQLAGELAAERAERLAATNRADTCAARAAAVEKQLEAERAERNRLAMQLEAEWAERDRLAVQLEAERAERHRAVEQREAERAERVRAMAGLESALAEAASRADRAVAQLEAERTERDVAVKRLAVDLAEARARGEQLERTAASAVGERDELVAQLVAERAIHESLRQDMTGRIEAALSSGRR